MSVLDDADEAQEPLTKVPCRSRQAQSQSRTSQHLAKIPTPPTRRISRSLDARRHGQKLSQPRGAKLCGERPRQDLGRKDVESGSSQE